jgi:hypothetical protein
MSPGQPDVQEHNYCQFQTFGSIYKIIIASTIVVHNIKSLVNKCYYQGRQQKKKLNSTYVCRFIVCAPVQQKQDYTIKTNNIL